MEGHTFSVYRGIIDEVLEKARADFQAEGADERVLDELRMMWENKLLMTNAIQPAGVLVEEKPVQAALEAPPQNAFFPTDLNYPPPPDLPTQEYVSVPHSGRGEASSSAAGGEDKPSTSANEGLQDVKRRRLSELGPGLENAADGLASASVPSVGVTVGSDGLRIRGGGGGDEDDEEDYNEEEPEKPPEVKEEVRALEELEVAGAEEDDLNELDDEEEQKEEEDDEAEATANIVLAQFEKVTRSKNKWKCTLKEGVIKLNGRDILFNKANGEFVW
ncbi:Transcription initiation factor IIA, alpha/beta subunit [Klebsormidium nitens]|uniref:Transcription initiation factor IIA, alpha/beta subunit n=1 Tax=Klebsormidium nitens TaxID=105231 RepID=A0A1Y1I1E4_KLENI|nr:Transcription initiation factor IIA, alpha/beta subunit [Klebsormidium nitens]|eukprot:GAQ83001.1 Transcription initiation factor IIA, alpha/beta subunit [Klebsormidium nitens]